MSRSKKPFLLTRDGESEALSADELRAKHPELSLTTSLLAMRPPRRLANVCPSCGWTSQKVEETERVGCPLCYESLDAPILRSFRAGKSSKDSGPGSS
ncbi:MAG: hypothetical protein KF784_08555 [Fimbriimonadaceae bacterium]|nr:hypothetical protein [Fimbriimonadaceae bacterium]